MRCELINPARTIQTDQTGHPWRQPIYSGTSRQTEKGVNGRTAQADGADGAHIWKFSDASLVCASACSGESTARVMARCAHVVVSGMNGKRGARARYFNLFLATRVAPMRGDFEIHTLLSLYKKSLKKRDPLTTCPSLRVFSEMLASMKYDHLQRACTGKVFISLTEN